MKLRNKKTGEVARRIDISANGKIIWVFDELHPIKYERLKDLVEDWEDYEPQEPLIEDKEIRDIIRAWADVNDAGKLKYIDDENSLNDIYRNTISFNRVLGLKDGWEYTIPELCGEEEE